MCWSSCFSVWLLLLSIHLLLRLVAESPNPAGSTPPALEPQKRGTMATASPSWCSWFLHSAGPLFSILLLAGRGFHAMGPPWFCISHQLKHHLNLHYTQWALHFYFKHHHQFTIWELRLCLELWSPHIILILHCARSRCCRCSPTVPVISQSQLWELLLNLSSC